jgi:hypothetical protein
MEPPPNELLMSAGKKNRNFFSTPRNRNRKREKKSTSKRGRKMKRISHSDTRTGIRGRINAIIEQHLTAVQYPAFCVEEKRKACLKRKKRKDGIFHEASRTCKTTRDRERLGKGREFQYVTCQGVSNPSPVGCLTPLDHSEWNGKRGRDLLRPSRQQTRESTSHCLLQAKKCWSRREGEEYTSWGC